MKKTRPALVRWSELDAEAQAAFKERVPKSNWPEDFDAETIRFHADGSSYRDSGLLADMFSVPATRPGPDRLRKMFPLG